MAESLKMSSPILEYKSIKNKLNFSFINKMMTSETPFLLKPNEQIITDAAYIQYYGVGYSTSSFHGGGLSHGLVGGISTSYTRKMNKSVFNAEMCHTYLTNQRVVFLKAKINILLLKENKIEGIFSDIPLEEIEAILPSKKFLLHPTIDISVREPNGEINLISFAFLVRQIFQNRNDERDRFIETLIKNWKMAQNSLSSIESPEYAEDPKEILKIRLAKGEITLEQYQKTIDTIS